MASMSGDDFEADRQWQKSCNEVMAIYRMTTLLSMGCKIKLSATPNKNRHGEGYVFRTDPDKSIDFVLVYKIPSHRKDPELNDSPTATPPTNGNYINDKRHIDLANPSDKLKSASHSQNIEDDVDQDLLDAKKDEEKHIRNRRNFHKSLRQLELNLEFEEFRVSGDHLRVVKLNVPTNIMMKSAEKFGFEKPLKCDRKDMERSDIPNLGGREKISKQTSSNSEYSPLSDDEEEGGERKSVITWLENKIFYLLHGKTPFYTNMRNNFYPKYVKALFLAKHKDKFLGSERKDFFTTAERSAVVYRVLQKAIYHKDGDNEYFGIDELVASGSYKAAFPLHDGPYDTDADQGPTNHRQLLRFHWASFRRWNKYQPINLIRMYFGEKVGMYFAWTGFYTQSLFIPAITGILVFGYGMLGFGDDAISKDICRSGKRYKMCPLCEDSKCPFYYLSEICLTAQMATSLNNVATLFFCVFMSIWVAYFLELWKRKQALLGHIWGTLKHDQSSDAQVRPTYTQNCDGWKYNPRSRRHEPFMSSKKRYPRYATTFFLILCILACVIIFALAVIVYDLAVYLALFDNASMKQYARLVSSLTAGVMSLTLIIIMSKYYTKFAIFMTEWENHRTQVQYENNLTVRRYVFEVFNFYSSLVYIGFFKGKFNGYPGHHPRVFGVKMEDCPPGGCISELATQMAIILAGKQFIFTFSQFVIPIIFSNKGSCWDRCKNTAKEVEGRKVKTPRTPWERDYMLAETRDVFSEYLEMVIQYGFVTIFVAAFPLAPLLALINNLLEMRLDAFKFVAQLRRPTGFKCKNIGIWSDILSTIGKIAVVCNAGIIAFSSDFLPMMLYAVENRERTKILGEPLHGYVNFSLAYASEKMTGRNGTCRYWAYRDKDGSLSFFYWKLFAVKLLFVIFFEHFVFGIVKCIDIFIPDIPESVQLRIDIDELIAGEVLDDDTSSTKVDTSTMTDNG